mgnify:CR=1 FL=1
MSKVFRSMGGMLLGATVAAGLVLLFAPLSGADTQLMIKERIEAILMEGRQAAEVRRLELHTQFETLKQPSSE